MPRRRADVKMLSCACTELEANVLGEMMAAGGATSDANLVRIALWSLADHMGLDVPNGAFDLRTAGAEPGRVRVKATVPNPKVRQDRPWRTPPHAHNARLHPDKDARVAPLPPERLAALARAHKKSTESVQDCTDGDGGSLVE